MAQKDPLVEYRGEGHAMFEELGRTIREEVLGTIFHAQLAVEEIEELREAQEASAVNGGRLSYEHDSLAGADAIAAGLTGDALAAGSVATMVPRAEQRVVGDNEKVGRNDPCWCGSGKKYKKCHGA
jgi:preprotein translocase subunit SecA